ncbi:MAG: cytochrome b [Burkholderiales bacterium]|nr:cytochrome b [Burkholderiales bacterium]
MVLAWGVLIPLATLVARFFKVTPGQPWPERLDNKFWWRTHVYAQSVAVAITAIAIALLWGSRSELALAQVHRAFAWAACALAVLQVAGGMLRGSKGGPTDVTLRGDHYDMTARRVVFEYVHKLAGYAAIACAAAAIVAGLVLVDAPRWMAIFIAGWWAALGFAFAWLQRQGWCIDTYQAIWGPGETHPGNRRRPIGIGVRRHDQGRRPLWPGHQPGGRP